MAFSLKEGNLGGLSLGRLGCGGLVFFSSTLVSFRSLCCDQVGQFRAPATRQFVSFNYSSPDLFWKLKALMSSFPIKFIDLTSTLFFF